MNYADGTPAQYGDLIINKPSCGNLDTVGFLVSASATTDTCNGNILPIAVRPNEKNDLKGTLWTPIAGANPYYSVTLKECWKLVALEANPPQPSEDAPTVHIEP